MKLANFAISRPLIHDRRGFAALLLVLTLIPLMMATSLAVEYGQMTQNQAAMNAAADSAALVATTTATNAFIAGKDPNYLTTGQNAGTAWFNSQTARLGLTNAPQSTVKVTQSGTKFTGVFTYTAQMPAVFGGMLNNKLFQISGSSTATMTATSYVDVQILMDTSSSMGIAATQDDMVALNTAIKVSPYWAARVPGTGNIACAFACHFTTDGKDFFSIAQNNGIQLRLNVVTQAVQNVITTMSAQNKNKNYSIGLYTFDKPGSYTTAYALSNDIPDATPAAAAIQIPLTNDSSSADTDIQSALTSFTTTIGQAGDGSSATSAKKYAFIITDGVVDYIKPNGVRTQPQTPINPAWCSALKANGVTVMVLYTPYIPLEGSFYNSYYAGNDAYFNDPPASGGLSANETAMQSCASSTQDFFSAESPADINNAMQLMVAAALSSTGRYTQ